MKKIVRILAFVLLGALLLGSAACGNKPSSTVSPTVTSKETAAPSPTDSTVPSVTPTKPLPTETPTETPTPMPEKETEADLWETYATMAYAYIASGIYPVGVAMYDRIPTQYRKMDELVEYARVLSKQYTWDEGVKDITITRTAVEYAVGMAESHPDSIFFQKIPFDYVFSWYGTTDTKNYNTLINRLYNVVNRYKELYAATDAPESEQIGAYSSIANAYLYLGKKDDALTLMQAKYAETKNRSYAEVLLNCYKETARYDKVLELAESILEGNEADSRALFYAGLGAMGTKDFDKVCEYGVKLAGIALNPEKASEINDATLFSFVNYLCLNDDALGQREGLACYTALSEDQKAKLESNEYLKLYIQAYTNTFTENLESEGVDNKKLARASVDSLLEKRPENAYAVYMKAALLEREESYAEALSTVEQAIGLWPLDSMFFLVAANCAENIEDVEKLYHYSNVAAGMHPWNPSTVEYGYSYFNDYYGVGIHAVLMQREAHRLIFQRANNPVPVASFTVTEADGKGIDKLLLCYEEKGVNEDALKLLQIVKALLEDEGKDAIDARIRSLSDKTSTGYFFVKSRWIAQYDRTQYLRTLWRDALELYPDWDYANYMMGLQAYGLKSYRAAKYYFSIAYALNPNNAYAALFLGSTYSNLMEQEKADFYYDVAREIFELSALEKSTPSNVNANVMPVVLPEVPGIGLVKSVVDFCQNQAGPNTIDTNDAGADAFSMILDDLNSLNDILGGIVDLGDVFPELNKNIGKPGISKVPDLAVLGHLDKILGLLDSGKTVNEAFEALSNPANSSYKDCPFIEFVDNIAVAAEGLSAIGQYVPIAGASDACDIAGEICGHIHELLNDPATVAAMKDWLNNSTFGQTLNDTIDNMNAGWTEFIRDFLPYISEEDLYGSDDQWTGSNYRERQYWYRHAIYTRAVKNGREKEYEWLRDWLLNNDPNNPTPNPSNLACKKPNIYLYPAEEMILTVKLENEERITVSDPIYNGGWRVTAAPGSKLAVDGLGYDYLFYECLVPATEFETGPGFLLPVHDRKEILSDILDKYGFNAKEKADFLEFWLEYLDADTPYLMIPQSQEMVDKAIPLDLSIPADTVYRIWFGFAPVYQDASKIPALSEASIRPIIREGFTVVEWGGAIITP